MMIIVENWHELYGHIIIIDKLKWCSNKRNFLKLSLWKQKEILSTLISLAKKKQKTLRPVTQIRVGDLKKNNKWIPL